MTVGEGCLIARSAKLDKTNPAGVQIGDYTAIAFGAAVLTHDFVRNTLATTRIGSNCFIGANSLIMPGVEIGDGSIVGAGSVVYTDVPSNSVVAGNPARIVEQGVRTGKWGMHTRGSGAPSRVPAPEVRQGGSHTAADLLSAYFPNVAHLAVPLADLGVDSFSLVTLRAEIEERTGQLIPDELWTRVETPADIAKFLQMRKVDPPVGAPKGTSLKRQLELNMPQMAMSGLSENWLFKEVGDMHWSMLASALGKRSSDIVDENGERLYATFTRIRYRSQKPLSAFKENDELALSSRLSRFGSGLFFSTARGESDGEVLEVEVMSSFSRLQEPGNSRTLIKGQPALPDEFSVPSAAMLPEIAREYRELRALPPAEHLQSCQYEINPVHDINGVGLLYFASYPTIAEVCLRKIWRDAADWSPVARDCCYFANSGPEETLEFGIVQLDVDEDHARAVCTLTRQDGTRMALITTEFARR
jgi:probable biosynthetic protein (TIGR04098 family)